MEWHSDSIPWVRLQKSRAVQCYFCGDTTAIVSRSDKSHDSGRVELYCDNPLCDARETLVLVLRDNTDETASRADVRALRALDHPPGNHGPAYTIAELAELVENDDLVGRRRSRDPMVLNLPDAGA
jgi:hypothetical protein